MWPTNLLDIDQWTEQMIVDAGASSCYVDYALSFGSGPFGHYICTDVNDAGSTGCPATSISPMVTCSLDLAIIKDGIAANAGISFIVGTKRAPEDTAMIDTTERAPAAGIAAAGPGVCLGDVSHAIGEVLTAAGHPINVDFGGHGIG